MKRYGIVLTEIKTVYNVYDSFFALVTCHKLDVYSSFVLLCVFLLDIPAGAYSCRVLYRVMGYCLQSH